MLPQGPRDCSVDCDSLPVLIVDECLPWRPIKAVLRGVFDVTSVEKEYGQGAKDEAWLPDACEKRWVILTKDGKLRSRNNERALISGNSGRVFMLTRGNLQVKMTVDLLSRLKETIAKHVRETVPPFICTISVSGTMRVIAL